MISRDGWAYIATINSLAGVVIRKAHMSNRWEMTFPHKSYSEYLPTLKAAKNRAEVILENYDALIECEGLYEDWRETFDKVDSAIELMSEMLSEANSNEEYTKVREYLFRVKGFIEIVKGSYNHLLKD